MQTIIKGQITKLTQKTTKNNKEMCILTFYNKKIKDTIKVFVFSSLKDIKENDFVECEVFKKDNNTYTIIKNNIKKINEENDLVFNSVIVNNISNCKVIDIDTKTFNDNVSVYIVVLDKNNIRKIKIKELNNGKLLEEKLLNKNIKIKDINVFVKNNKTYLSINNTKQISLIK